MKQCKGYRYRIYPTKAQSEKISEIFGCTRFAYNYCLNLRRDVYETESRNVSQYECMRRITELRHMPEYCWLAACDSMALQESVKDLNKAYTNFFKKRGGYPRYHSKRSTVQSYRTRNQGNGIRFENGKLRLPVLGLLKIKKSRDFSGRILNATVKRTAAGRYFVSLCVEEDVIPADNAGGIIGIDVGIKDFCSDSNGNVVPNPRTLRRYEKKLKREQRKLARMIESNITGYRNGPKGGRIPVYAKPLSECRNIQKQRRKVALVHEKVFNIRTDFLHKQSAKLVNENQVIAIEDLNVKGMVRNHKLAKAVSDISWSRFFSMLEYKALEHGTEILRVPTFYPSSQLCSVCGHKNPLVKNLKVREWDCPKCGSHHDRDKNAAVNILNKALQMQTM